VGDWQVIESAAAIFQTYDACGPGAAILAEALPLPPTTSPISYLPPSPSPNWYRKQDAAPPAQS